LGEYRNAVLMRLFLKAVDGQALPEIISVTPMPDAKTSPFVRVSRRMALLLLLFPVVPFVSVLAAARGTAPNQSPMPRTQKHEVRHEIDQLEETWREALLKSDTAVMGTLLADDYIAISASGTLETKEQTLANLRDGRFHITSLELSDRKVRFYGTTALVTSRADVTGTTQEGDISGSHRYTRVYVRDKRGAWKIVSFEVSPIKAPGDHK
jgi:ketosteroid isomerase-like protein